MEKSRVTAVQVRYHLRLNVISLQTDPIFGTGTNDSSAGFTSGISGLRLAVVEEVSTLRMQMYIYRSELDTDNT